MVIINKLSFIYHTYIIILGFSIDKIGRRAQLLLISAVIGFLFYYGIYYFHVYFSLFLMGTSYSLFASVIFPSVALVVSPHLNGLAFGIMQSGINVFLVISPIIVSQLYEVNNTYDTVWYSY